MTGADVVARFPGAKRNGSGWAARCPAHEDRRASLSITEKPDRTLLYCHAGCEPDAVAGSVGLSLADLFADAPSTSGTGNPSIAASYDYTDEDGALLYQVVRHLPKDFRQRKPDGNGGWIWKLGDVRRVPYRLPEVLEAIRVGRMVFIVEGEKDADRLHGLGLAATCNAGGAGKWTAELSGHFRGAHVVILPDNDEPGRKHAADVAAKLHGIAAGVRIVELPGLPTKGDASDWLHAGGTVDALNGLAGAAPLWEPGKAEFSPAEPTTASELVRLAGLSTLGADPTPDAVEKALRSLTQRLNGVDPLRVETAKAEAVRKLKEAKVPGASGLVKTAFASPADRGTGDSHRQGRPVTLNDPEPWPDPVDGVALLSDLVRTFVRFLALPEGAPTALALWTLHAHSHDAAAISPLLALTSPEKRCGKTTTLSLIGALVPRPLGASNISPAALFRTVEAYRPTLLVDEADTFLERSDELRGILNSGHTRATAVVVRIAGEDLEPRLFSTWAPKVLAKIGELPATLEDRSVVIRLRRRARGEIVERLRLDRLAEELEPLRRRAARWASDHREQISAADPEVPPVLHDRAADNWRSLLAIADAAGGHWPERARRAAVLLGGASDDGDAAGPKLLADLQTLFEQRATDRLPSADIVSALNRMEDRPWPEWRRGKPLTVRQLAGLLERYGVRPQQIRFGPTDSRKGYQREDLADAFLRYLDPDGSETAKHPGNGAKKTAPVSETGPEGVSERNDAKPAQKLRCFAVSDENPVGGAPAAVEPEPEVLEL